MARRIQIDERLVQEAASEITRLRTRLAQYEGDGIADAIQTSLQRPVQPDGGRNGAVSDITRAGIFRDRPKPVKKAEREHAETDRRMTLRRELDRAKGLRPRDR
jgi:hypothetical protein